jgi:hypothetical protein
VQKESLCFASILSTCFCWIEGAWTEAAVVVVSFCSPFEQDCEEAEFCSMRYYLAALFRWDSSWNYLWYPVEMTPRVTMTLRGRDS